MEEGHGGSGVIGQEYNRGIEHGGWIRDVWC